MTSFRSCGFGLRFFQLGVTLLFGGLFLKSWRLHRIFFGNLLQRDSNARLLLMLGGFVSFDLVCRRDRVWPPRSLLTLNSALSGRFACR